MVNEEIITYPGWPATVVHEILVSLGIWAPWVWHAFGVFFLIIGFVLICSSRNRTVQSKWQGDWLFLLCISTLTFLLRLPNIVLPELNSDESQFIVGAATLVQDFRPWLVVDAHTSGPLNIIPLTVVSYLGGGMNYGSIRVFVTMVFIIPICILFYFTLKGLLSPVWAKLLSLPLPLFFAYQINLEFIAFNSETFPMLLTAAVLLVATRLLQENGGSILWFLLLGFLMGCAPYAKLQSVPIFFLIGLFFCIHLLSRKNYKPFTALILSSIAPSLAIACYVIGNDLQQFFLESYIKANLWYTKYDISGEVAHSLFDKLVTLLDLLANNVASLAPIAAVTAVTVYVVFKSILQWTIVDISKDKIFLLLLFCFIGAILSVLIPGNRFDHYLYLLVVPSCALSSYIIGRCALPDLDGQGQRLRIWHKALFSGVMFLYPFLNSLNYGNPGIDFILANEKLAPSIVPRAIAKHSRPNQKLAMWGFEPRYYIESRLLQGTREAHSYNQTFNNMQGEYFRERYIQDLESNKPEVFIDVSSPGKFLYDSEKTRHEMFPLIKNYIEQNYYLVEIVDGVRIFLRR